MPQILFTWLLTSLAALLWGSLAETGIRSWFQDRKNSGIWMQFWTGLIFISLILSLCTLFIPLTGFVKSILWIIILLFPAFLQPKQLFALAENFRRGLANLHPLAWLPGVLSTLIGLLKAAGTPEIFDEGAYHLPLIRMWEQQGLVPGYANLNGHFGLHSVWHLLSAFTSLDFLPGFRSEMCLNGLLACILGMFASSRLSRILRNQQISPVSAMVAVLLPVLLFRNLLSSPATDIPAIAGTWFFFLLWLESLENRDDLSSKPDLFLFLPVWVVSVKSSSAGLLAVPLIFTVWILTKTERKAFVIPILFTGSLLFLWMTQNWLLTGYAVFPMEFTAIGHPAWQVPAESMEKKFYLEQFGAFAPPKTYSISWLWDWFHAHNPDSRVIILLATLFLLSSPFLFWGKLKSSASYVAFYLLLFLQILIWFFTITEPRYGFGALVIAALLGLAWVLKQLLHLNPGFRFLLISVVPIMGWNSLKTLNEYREQGQNMWMPARPPVVEFRKIKCGNFIAATPVHYIDRVPAGKPVFCWDCPFPCLPLEGIQDSSHVFRQTKALIPYFYFKK